ncbi:L-idonate 5-dehydrogenase [Paramesorhizobium deserti]|uniref:L-idonate 5-dehydrogenase n=1 Tax=Paramesorhizobium deserti TaxID=1494590 RepID=A0A135HY68_9HYPH|nr:L-idonate 5-dehydrogenase [Paramesorhizobium deserti]KXF78142.1 L-idonate 5-dehydrogenase [Paramesorhizobium deserti]
MPAVMIYAAGDLRVEASSRMPPGPGRVEVSIGAGGICGSDIHYYRHGGFGTIRIREPMALGHEISGTVTALGEGVSNLAIGTRVAVNPSQPCGQCVYCQRGMRNECLDMRFMGSAMRFPHVQGGFRSHVVVEAAQAVPIAETLSLAEAAMAEPLAVCLHAIQRAPSLMGKRVLVTGCGPIGALTILAARFAGAAEVVVTDIAPFPLAKAMEVGATRGINTAEEPEALDPEKAEKGQFDVVFEASGAEQAARLALDVLRPGGTFVQLGLGGDMNLPINIMVTKEIAYVGSFRFDSEFALAVQLLGKGLIDVKPLITATLPAEQAVDAFELATDRSRSMKTQLSFT